MGVTFKKGDRVRYISTLPGYEDRLRVGQEYIVEKSCRNDSEVCLVGVSVGSWGNFHFELVAAATAAATTKPQGLRAEDLPVGTRVIMKSENNKRLLGVQATVVSHQRLGLNPKFASVTLRRMDNSETVVWAAGDDDVFSDLELVEAPKPVFEKPLAEVIEEDLKQKRLDEYQWLPIQRVNDPRLTEQHLFKCGVCGDKHEKRFVTVELEGTTLADEEMALCQPCGTDVLKHIQYIKIYGVTPERTGQTKKR